MSPQLSLPSLNEILESFSYERTEFLSSDDDAGNMDDVWVGAFVLMVRHQLLFNQLTIPTANGARAHEKTCCW